MTDPPADVDGTALTDDEAPPLTADTLDPGRGTQAHIQGLMSNSRIAVEGASTLARIGGRFACIRAALLESASVSGYTASAIAFPASVVAEAATAARMQEIGYDILRQSSLAEASMTGEAGSEAAYRIGEGFDAECADLISRGTFTLDLDPLEMLLGVLPVLQLATHLWYRDHVPPRLGASRLEQAAASLPRHRRPVHPTRRIPPLPHGILGRQAARRPIQHGHRHERTDAGHQRLPGLRRLARVSGRDQRPPRILGPGGSGAWSATTAPA